MQQSIPASLILANGMIFNGFSFGHEQAVAGEVVFNTAMTGYPENLTDPSYSGQILVSTFPLVGNYGVPKSDFINGTSAFFESEKIQVSGFIVSNYSAEYSHWNAEKSLNDWLKEHRIPAIYGIDTRELTKVLREAGSMLGKIVTGNHDTNFIDPDKDNQVAKVSCKELIRYGKGAKTVVVVDCGVKHSILRRLLQYDVNLIRVPWDYDFNHLEYDGLFLSNGPGDPNHCEITVQHIRKAMEKKKPVCGIGIGHLLLAKAGGAGTVKLKYGHRSHNQPVRLVGTNRCFITSQNHGFTIDENTLSNDWEPSLINMNDGTNEGIRHKNLPFFSAQFYPEPAGVPSDLLFLFDDFIALMK
jgi:carbamoyl-phosphate synthase small subunit